MIESLTLIPTDELIEELRSRFHVYAFAYAIHDEENDPHTESGHFFWGNYYGSLGLVSELQNKMMDGEIYSV